MPALRIYAGPLARQAIEKHGLAPQDIGVVPGAAGGPKGLILGPLDRFIFGQWLPQSSHTVHLVGASIGAWRMAAACLNQPALAFKRLEDDYIDQHYPLEPGQKRHSPAFISGQFGQNLQSFYGGRIPEVLLHPRYRLHIFTSRGRHLLAREQAWRTPLGYASAFFANLAQRKAMGAWLERVVFSTAGAALPFATSDYKTRQVALSEANFNPALQASCSIPFVLRSVQGIPGAPPGAYWDGGITDYHLHLNYNAPDLIATQAVNTMARGTFNTKNTPEAGKIVLYPHFQKAVVPGWLDKHLAWRHQSTHFLDHMVLLAPNPEWVKTLPNGKLPDRTDFTRYGPDLPGRVRAWTAAVSASQQMADEFAAWLDRPELMRVECL